MSKNFKFLGYLLVITVLGLMIIPTFSAVAQDAKYNFYYVSHMGPADPNSNWFKEGIKEFESHYPEVNAEYIAPPDPTPRKQLERLRTIIAKDPDGLIVSMTAPEMFDDVLRDTINKKDIPVVAFNIADPRPREERIPYLCYVGGGEYKVGYRLGQYYQNNFEKPQKVAIAQFNPGHSGLEERARGMTDVMKEAGVAVDKVALSPEAGGSKSKLTSYLQRNTDVDVIFSVTTYGEPWVVSVLENLERMNSTDIIGVDASATSLEGIKQGIIQLSMSQGFYLQAYLPMEILYMYNEYGLAPAEDVLTGPIVIDKSNVGDFSELVRNIFGEEDYEKMVAW